MNATYTEAMGMFPEASKGKASSNDMISDGGSGLLASAGDDIGMALDVSPDPVTQEMKIKLRKNRKNISQAWLPDLNGN